MESRFGNTALHIASHDGSLAVVQFLLNFNAHIDSMNMYQQTPLDVAQTVDMRTLFKSKQTPSKLKCLCARLIMEGELSYEVPLARRDRFKSIFIFTWWFNERKTYSFAK